MKLNSLQMSDMMKLSSQLPSTGNLFANSSIGFNRKAARYAIQMQYGAQQNAVRGTASNAASRTERKSASDAASRTASSSSVSTATNATRVQSPKKTRTDGIEEGKTSGERWDSYLEEVKAQARKDAAAGKYKSDDFQKLESGYRDTYVAPDRDKATAEADKIVRQSAATAGTSYYKAQGSTNTVSVNKLSRTPTSEIFNENGEVIARKQGASGKWTSVSTKAEDYASQETNRVYMEAYKAATLEAKSAQEKAVDGTGQYLDVRV